jgi:hypothetical protein
MARFRNRQEATNQVVNNGQYRTAALELETIYGFSYQAVWTGAGIAGNIKIQVSNMPEPDETTDTDWEDLADSEVAFAGATSQVYNVTDSMYKWARLWIEETNAANLTLNAWVMQKGT